MPRPSCARCRRPEPFCWCRHLAPVETRTRVIFLQHPRESRVRIGTARMAHLALPNSELHVGLRYPHLPGPRTALLFPGAGALPPSALVGPEPWTLVVVDGTWSQARKVAQRDPVLRALPQVGLAPDRPGRYRIRREPAAHCLATVEAVADVLGQVEGEPGRFESMIEAFTWMVDRQLAAAAANRSVRHRKAVGGADRWLHAREAVRAVLPRLVLVHAEANAHGRSSGAPGPPELVHLAAVRPATGARHEVVLAPRRPLGPAVPGRLGLTAAALHGGAPAAEALARFGAFLAPGDVLGSWGRWPLDLLRAEGHEATDRLDLRALASAGAGRRPGSLEAAVALAGGRTRTPPARGRAGRTLAGLLALVDALAPS